MNIRQYYEGKCVFITGTTGFIGKVVLEKILRDLSNVGVIYILVRSKGEKNAQHRLEEEIITTPLFDVLRDRYKDDFLSFITSKVIPIEGDIYQPNFALSPANLELIQNNVNIIIHIAANVDFTMRLDRALESNVLGTMTLLSLSKQFKYLQAFVHCSTAYVNCFRQGAIEEELVPISFDPEEVYKQIVSTAEDQIESFQNYILAKYKYPNTYTFTKTIAEHLIAKNRGEIPLYIVRPTVVGATWKEPFPGWVDTLGGAAGVLLFSGLGVLSYLHCKRNTDFDSIPCDFVSNCLIMAAPALEGQNTLKICHVGVSDKKKITFKNVSRYCRTYWRYHQMKKRIGPPGFNRIMNPLLFSLMFIFLYYLPTVLYSFFTWLFGGAAMKRNDKNLQKRLKIVGKINDVFRFFINSTWVFNTVNLLSDFEKLDEESKLILYSNVAEIDNEKYFYSYCYGLNRFFMKETTVKPPSKVLSANIIAKQRWSAPSLFSDIRWAATTYSADNIFFLLNSGQTSSRILRTDHSEIIANASSKIASDSLIGNVEKKASIYLKSLYQPISINQVRLAMWSVKKMLRKMFRSIRVDEHGLQLVKEAIARGPVVLIPSQRSHMDIFILLYIFFSYNVPLPRMAVEEDLMKFPKVRKTIQNCGEFTLQNNIRGNSLYNAILTSFVEHLILESIPLLFSLEGEASVSGKPRVPNLELLEAIMKPLFADKVADVQIYPISISYDKVVEEDIFTSTMRGSKVKSSLSYKAPNKDWGNINVAIGAPISARSYSQDFLSDPNNHSFRSSTSISVSNHDLSNLSDNSVQNRVIFSLSRFVLAEHNRNMAITPTAIVSTILLAHRKGINKEELINKSEWLRNELIARSVEVECEEYSEAMVNYSLRLIGKSVRKDNDIYTPVNDGKSVMSLHYYRNQLMHVFFWEGIVAITLEALSGLKISENVEENKVDEKIIVEEVLFWVKFWDTEFLLPPYDYAKKVTDILTQMCIMRTVDQAIGSTYAVTPQGREKILFLCQLFEPFVEACYVACRSLFTISEFPLKGNILVQRMRILGEKMLADRNINYSESCNTDILTNVVSSLIEMGILLKKLPVNEPKSSKHIEPEAYPSDPDLDLSPEYVKEDGAHLVEHISQFLKLPVS